MNTRWRPTPYRDLHVGHIPSLYDSWETSRIMGGKFIVIFDDLVYGFSEAWNRNWSMAESVKRWREDIEWLGIVPDEVAWSSRNAEHHFEFVQKLGLRRPGSVSGVRRFSLRMGERAEDAEGRMRAAGPVPGVNAWYLTAKIADDHTHGVAGFSRGMDLCYERGAYELFWRLLHPAGNPPTQRYVPMIWAGSEKMSNSSENVITIRALREAGYEGPAVVSTVLRLIEDSENEQVFIPDDLLTTDRVATLKRKGKDWYAMMTSAYGKPWQHDVLRVGHRLRRTSTEA